jgi:hypothetical protein
MHDKCAPDSGHPARPLRLEFNQQSDVKCKEHDFIEFTRRLPACRARHISVTTGSGCLPTNHGPFDRDISDVKIIILRNVSDEPIRWKTGRKPNFGGYGLGIGASNLTSELVDY